MLQIVRAKGDMVGICRLLRYPKVSFLQQGSLMLLVMFSLNKELRMSSTTPNIDPILNSEVGMQAITQYDIPFQTVSWQKWQSERKCITRLYHLLDKVLKSKLAD